MFTGLVEALGTVTKRVASGPDARLVISTGQSGLPFDRHYTDQIEPWRGGTTLPLPFTPGAIDRATVTTLTLQPAS